MGAAFNMISPRTGMTKVASREHATWMAPGSFAFKHAQRCHPAVAALAVMRARLPGLRNAVGLRNAPATRCEFSVSRTAFDFTVESSFTLNLAVPAGLPVAAERLPTKVERATLPPPE